MLSEINYMVEAEPKIFKNNFKDLQDVMRAIVQMQVSIDSIRSSALEIMVLSFEMLPAVVKNDPSMIRDFFECVFGYMVTCVEEIDQEWLTPPEGMSPSYIITYYYYHFYVYIFNKE